MTKPNYLLNQLRDLSTPLPISARQMVAEELEWAYAEVARMQRILDSRPAINAGLPETYIVWSRSIYAMELRPEGEELQ